MKVYVLEKKVFIFASGGQNILPQNMPLGHIGYFKIVILNKQQETRTLETE